MISNNHMSKQQHVEQHHYDQQKQQHVSATTLAKVSVNMSQNSNLFKLDIATISQAQK